MTTVFVRPPFRFLVLDDRAHKYERERGKCVLVRSAFFLTKQDKQLYRCVSADSAVPSIPLFFPCLPSLPRLVCDRSQFTQPRTDEEIGKEE